MSLILPLMNTKVFLVVKVLMKQVSLICFRVYLEACLVKNPTCFSRWSVSIQVSIIYAIYTGVSRLLLIFRGGNRFMKRFFKLLPVAVFFFMIMAVMSAGILQKDKTYSRSEERRVGKVCGSRWWAFG